MHAFISFSFITLVAWTSNKKLEVVGVGILVLFLVLKEKLSIFIVEYDGSCGFVINGLYYDEICFLSTNFQSFYHKWYWILRNAFSASIDMLMIFIIYFANVVYPVD